MRRLLLLSLCAAVALSGCALLSQLFQRGFRKPTLEFRSAQLQQASLSDATIHLNFELANPNPLGLKLDEIAYAFFVEGKQVVAGSPPRGLSIPATGRAPLVFPANVKFADIAPVVTTFLTKDVAHYRAEGRIGIQTPLGMIRLPISKEGDFEVPKLPEVSLGTPRIRGLDFASATVEFPITVTNRNTYALPIDRVQGGLSIAGAPVGTLGAQLGALPPRGRKDITVPLTIHFASALAAANAIRQGSATVTWDMNVASGSVQLPLRIQQNLAFHR